MRSFFYSLSSEKVIAMRLPFYAKAVYPSFPIATTHTIHMMDIVNFLKFAVEHDELEIAEYLDKMGQDPFFLVAATGLGKTVAVPVHNLIRQIQHAGARPHPEPRVWVIEPRIPIAVDQAHFMNGLWHEFQQSKGHKKVPPLFGCITSASGNVNPEAPVKFITTGIFGILTKQDELKPERDRVIIDEAHVTVEQSPEVELGIALARRAGITVDYMSATVDTTGLSESLSVANIIRADKARHVVWMHNLLRPIDKALPELVQNTLIQPDPSSSYFPQDGDFAEAEAVRRAVLETGRSHGMLVVVNSFAGNQSDTQRLANQLRKAYPELPVLQLASEVIRDVRRSQEFKQELRRIETARQNYVILSTSVVEMGITFPTLDYAVTMDCGYDQETIGDVTFPVVAPLGTNSLLQRKGRVGRKRPGIAYISREVGAEFAELDDDELNSGTLTYEPIRFPMASTSLMPLAYFACQQNWGEGEDDGLTEWVTSLNLPSRLHEDYGRMEYLNEQIDMLEELELAEDSWLTPLGERMEQWTGRADLAYALQLQKRFEEGAGLAEVLFWTVATALSNTPLVALRAQHDYFVDYDGSRGAIAHSFDLWSGYEHEDLAVFGMVAQAAARSPYSLFGNQGFQLQNWDTFEFERWCDCAGIDARKLQKAGKAITETWKLLGRVNSESRRFQELVGSKQVPSLITIPWRTIWSELPTGSTYQNLCSLSGTTNVRLEYNSASQGFDWCDEKHGHTGLVSQDDTPIRLSSTMPYVARVVPSRETKEVAATWRLAHLGVQQSTKPAATPPVVSHEQLASQSVPSETQEPPQLPRLRDRLIGLFRRK